MPKNTFTDHFGVRDYFHSRKIVINFLCRTVVLVALFLASGYSDIRAFARTRKLQILSRRCRLSEQEWVRFFNGIKTLAGDDSETHRIFQPEGATHVTKRNAEGLVATGMLRDKPPNPLFNGRIVEFPKP